jgi:hypothetical protein
MMVVPSDDLATRIRTASRSCPDAVSGQAFRSPAQAFADLARSCADLDIEEWDFYGESVSRAALKLGPAEMAALVTAAIAPSAG